MLFRILLLLISCRSEEQKNKTEDNLTLLLTGFLDIFIVEYTILMEIIPPAGEIFSLPCEVNTSQCGDYHSLKWYKVEQRAVQSD